jgi:hypothetical protein
MTSDQYRAKLEKLGLSIVGCAPYIGISRRQSQRIAAGESPVPMPVAKLLSIVVKHEISLEELEKIK